MARLAGLAVLVAAVVFARLWGAAFVGAAAERATKYKATSGFRGGVQISPIFMGRGLLALCVFFLFGVFPKRASRCCGQYLRPKACKPY